MGFRGAAKADTWRKVWRRGQSAHKADTWQTHGGQGLEARPKPCGTRPEPIAVKIFFLREHQTVNCLGKNLKVPMCKCRGIQGSSRVIFCAKPFTFKPKHAPDNADNPKASSVNPVANAFQPRLEVKCCSSACWSNLHVLHSVTCHGI